MFINPREVIQNGWLSGINDPTTQLQPNAIDFTIDDLFYINFEDTAYVSNNKKLCKMRQLSKIPLQETDPGYWHLNSMQVYDGVSNVYVKIPAGYACVPVFTRSTLTRNGVFLMSGMYDSGFEGHVGFTIYTMGGPIQIEKGTRVGQIGFVRAENAHMYAGGWNHQQGTHYTETVQPGQRQIPSDPNRKDVGMGPILRTDSEFL